MAEQNEPMGAAGYWAWQFEPELDSWIELARYVVVSQLPVSVRAMSEDVLRTWDPGDGLKRLELVWEQFAALGIPYRAPAWVAGRRQRLRDPVTVLQDGGTCVDLALFFSAMCIAAGLRPYLIVDPAWKPGVGHVVVGVDTSTEPNSLVGGIAHSRGATTPENHLVEVLSRRDLDEVRHRTALNIVDCTHAARAGRPGDGLPRAVQDLDTAVRNGKAFVRHRSDAYRAGWKTGEVGVVDVCAVQRFHSPADLDRSVLPAITSQLPEVERWIPFPSRVRLGDEAVEHLRADHGNGWVILYGDAGVGKSRLAYEVATQFEVSGAWFLTANDDKTLRRSLATVGAAETGRPLPDNDPAGRDEVTASALARLHASELPWLVILDNANCSPRELRSRPRVRPDRGQRAVVTTLPEYVDAWKAAIPDAVFREVSALSGEDLDETRSDLPDAARSAAQGSALLVRAYGALAERVGTAELTGALAEHTEGSGARRLWAVARHFATSEERASAHRVAWLPPDGIPQSLVGPLAVGLRGLGLLTLSLTRPAEETLFDLHRTLGAALRSTDPDPATNVLAVLGDTAAREHLNEFGNTDTLDELARVLVAAYDDDPNRPGLGLAMVELASLYELYGRTLASTGPYYAEEFHRRAASVPEVKAEPLVLAECLHGMGRAVNQDPQRSGKAARGRLSAEEYEATNTTRAAWVDEALGWVGEALRLRDGYPRPVARTNALLGLLQQKKAHFVPPDKTHEILIEALETLTVSRDERQRIICAERKAAGYPANTLDHDPEIARARFNLAGVANNIAVSLPAEDQPGRRRHLSIARETYEGVLALRREIYGGARPSPHLAACFRGLALIDYQETWLLDLTDDQRTDLLRRAFDTARTALELEQRLDVNDGTDIGKSLDLISKIVDMRQSIRSGGERNVDQIRAKGDAERDKVIRPAGTP